MQIVSSLLNMQTSQFRNCVAGGSAYLMKIRLPNWINILTVSTYNVGGQHQTYLNCLRQIFNTICNVVISAWFFKHFLELCKNCKWRGDQKREDKHSGWYPNCFWGCDLECNYVSKGKELLDLFYLVKTNTILRAQSNEELSKITNYVLCWKQFCK